MTDSAIPDFDDAVIKSTAIVIRQLAQRCGYRLHGSIETMSEVNPDEVSEPGIIMPVLSNRYVLITPKGTYSLLNDFEEGDATLFSDALSCCYGEDGMTFINEDTQESMGVMYHNVSHVH